MEVTDQSVRKLDIAIGVRQPAEDSPRLAKARRILRDTASLRQHLAFVSPNAVLEQQGKHPTPNASAAARLDIGHESYVPLELPNSTKRRGQSTRLP